MALTTSYLVKTTDFDKFLDTIRNAQAPEKFTHKFLQDLGYKSTNDRLYIGMLKALGFLDDSSIPTTRYYNFLDPDQSNQMLKDGIEEAYEDLFAININAQDLSFTEVKGKLKSLTQGAKSDKVYSLMARTFKTLTEIVDWDEINSENNSIDKKDKSEESNKTEVIEKKDSQTNTSTKAQRKLNKLSTDFHYNIQIHLPASRDASVYDAIFQSLKKHLIDE